MTRRELGARLAVVTALEKAVKRAKDEIRADAEEMMALAYQEDGISSIDLLIGDEKVGRLGIGKPGVGIYAGQSYPKWAYENGMGERSIVVDVSDAGDRQLDALTDLLVREDLPFETQYKASDSAKRALAVKGDRVISGDGEVVPGTYVKRPGIRVTGCKPEDVGEAMGLLGDGSTVAGLLAGGDE